MSKTHGLNKEALACLGGLCDCMEKTCGRRMYCVRPIIRSGDRSILAAGTAVRANCPCSAFGVAYAELAPLVAHSEVLEGFAVFEEYEEPSSEPPTTLTL